MQGKDASSPPGRLRTSAALLAYAALTLVVAGSLIRLTCRDSYLPAAIVFYATPPAAMVWLSVFAFLFLPRSARRWRAGSAMAVVLAACWMWHAQWIATSRANGDVATKTHQLLFWNVCEARPGWNRILQEVAKHDADIVVLAESDTLPIEDLPATLHTARLPGRLLLMSKHPIAVREQHSLNNAGICHVVDTDLSGHGVTLILVDIKSTISIHRQISLEALSEIASRQINPTLVVGDFNTPTDSRFLEAIRSGYRNAFEEAGYGLHATWPLPLPVMAIDQIWGNDGVRFHSAQIDRRLLSDHACLRCEFSVP